MPSPGPDPRLYQCDSCDHIVGGYTRRDLENDGWVWHGPAFVMCDVCEDDYKQRRTRKQAEGK